MGTIDYLPRSLAVKTIVEIPETVDGGRVHRRESPGPRSRFVYLDEHRGRAQWTYADGIGAPGRLNAVIQQALSVLVVDDNAPDVVLIRESLNEHGLDHTITHCANGREALDVLEKGQPHAYDVMILDLNMPKVGGLEVLARLRKMPEMESLPVLVLTSSLAPDEQAQAMSLGANRFLRKPADLDRFLNDVGTAVRELTQNTRL